MECGMIRMEKNIFTFLKTAPKLTEMSIILQKSLGNPEKNLFLFLSDSKFRLRENAIIKTTC